MSITTQYSAVDFGMKRTFELEYALLGHMIDHSDIVASSIRRFSFTPDHFTTPANKKLFKTLYGLFEKGIEMDPYILQEEYRIATGEEWNIAYEAELRKHCIYSLNTDKLMEYVHNNTIKRSIVNEAQKILALAESAQSDGISILDQARANLDEIVLKGVKSPEKEFGSKVEDVVTNVIDISSGKIENPALLTGVKDFDDNVGGLFPTEVTIIAARPSLGKTALALSLVHSMAFYRQEPGIIFSIEMSSDALIKRMLAIESGVDGRDIRRGKVKALDIIALKDASVALKSAPLIIDDEGDLTLAMLRSKIKRGILSKGIKYAMIDYLQLMIAPKAQTRERELALLSRGCKMLAKEFNIPIVIMAQLNRESESNEDKRPELRNLRESGSIEQDADNVLFIHRPEYYGIDSLYDNTSSKNMAEIIIAKSRNDQTGIFKLHYSKEITKFSSPSYREDGF